MGDECIVIIPYHFISLLSYMFENFHIKEGVSTMGGKCYKNINTGHLFSDQNWARYLNSRKIIWRLKKNNVFLLVSQSELFSSDRNSLRWADRSWVLEHISLPFLGKRTYLKVNLLGRQALGDKASLWGSQGPHCKWTEEQGHPRVRKIKGKELKCDNGDTPLGLSRRLVQLSLALHASSRWWVFSLHSMSEDAWEEREPLKGSDNDNHHPSLYCLLMPHLPTESSLETEKQSSHISPQINEPTPSPSIWERTRPTCFVLS